MGEQDSKSDARFKLTGVTQLEFKNDNINIHNVKNCPLY